jgi:hypothetical protein
VGQGSSSSQSAAAFAPSTRLMVPVGPRRCGVASLRGVELTRLRQKETWPADNKKRSRGHGERALLLRAWPQIWLGLLVSDRLVTQSLDWSKTLSRLSLIKFDRAVWLPQTMAVFFFLQAQSPRIRDNKSMARFS